MRAEASTAPEGDAAASALVGATLGHGNAALRSGSLYFEALINSPPIFLLDNPQPSDGGTPGHLSTGWNPRLEATLSWASAIAYAAPGQINFAWDPPTISDVDHVAAQAAYAAAATQIAGALHPELTSAAFGVGLAVRADEARTSLCALRPSLQGKGALPTVEPIGRSSVFAAGFARPWTGPDGGDGFCAFVVAVNACDRPTTTELLLGGDRGVAVPASIVEANRVFGQYYNVTIGAEGAEGAGRRMSGVAIDGYDTAIFRVGCEGWKETQ